MTDYTELQDTIAMQLVNAADEGLAIDEGFRSTKYKDELGNWTIGYGINIKQHPEYDVKFITKAVAKKALDQMIIDIIKKLKPALPFFDTLGVARQSVLINIAYNVGTDGLLDSKIGFKNLLQHIKEKNFVLASSDIMDSEAARVNTARYERLSQIMLYGEL